MVFLQKPSDTTELNQSHWLITTIYRTPKPRKNARCPASGRHNQVTVTHITTLSMPTRRNIYVHESP